MNKAGPKMQWVVWVGLVLTAAVIIAAYILSKIAANATPLPVIGQLSDFTLTNQDARPMSLADLRGRVWVADVIFTRCPGPCASMTKRLAELQTNLPTDGSVRIVSLTSDPEYDTPTVLKRYAEKFGADTNRWSFLTGDKKTIRSLAVNDFKFVVVEKKPEEREIPDDLFIHSTWFVLVDASGRARGWNDASGQIHAYYDSTEPEALAQLRADLKRLLNEKQP